MSLHLSNVTLLEITCHGTSVFLFRSELRYAKATGYLTAAMEVLQRNGIHLCVYAVVLTYYLKQQHFRAETIYTTIGLLNAVGMNILIYVSLAIRTAIQMNVSINRITVSTCFTLYYYMSGVNSYQYERGVIFCFIENSIASVFTVQ